MAGLFSTAGQDLAASEENLGSTIFKAGMTIYDKLNEAEEAVQTQQGQLILSQAMNQFDSQIAQDPDTDSYQQKWAKAKDDAWQLAEKSINNQGAKNALSDWWNQTSIQQSKKLENQTIQTRIQNALDLLKMNMDSLTQKGDKNSVVQGLNAAVSANLISQAGAETEKAKIFHTIDYNTVLHTAHSIAFDSKGGDDNLDAALNAVWADTDHGLSDPDKQEITDTIQKQHEEASKLAKEKTDKENGDKYDQAVKHIVAGKVGPTKLTTDPRYQFAGSQAGETTEKLVDFWKNLHTNANANNPGYGYALTMDKLDDKTKTVSELNEMVIDAFNNGDVNKGQVTTLMDKIKSGISTAEVQARTYLHEGTRLYSEDDEMKAQNMLDEALAAKGKDASPEYVQKQAEVIKKIFSDQGLRKAIDDQFVWEKKSGLAAIFSPKPGTPKKEDIAEALHALGSDEFSGTLGTHETQVILQQTTTQLKNLIVSKFGITGNVNVDYDDKGLPIFKSDDGSQVRVTEDGGKIMLYVGKPDSEGTISWSEQGVEL
jgi:hypothetical protein